MNLHDAEALARDLMAEHGIDRAGWTFAFDDTTQRLGSCQFTKKTITLSRHYVQAADEQHIRDTVLHEIAHVFAPGDLHGLRWKAVALRLGATPKACSDNPFFTSTAENARRLAAVDGKPYVRIAKAGVRGNRYRVLRENTATIVLVDENGGEVRAARPLVYPDGESEPTMTDMLAGERQRNLAAVAGRPPHRTVGPDNGKRYAILRSGGRGRRHTLVNLDTGNILRVDGERVIPIQETGAQMLGRMVLPRH